MKRRLSDIRQVFLDMDGTIYRGSTLFPTTLPFLRYLKERGVGYAFLSNNSSFSTAEYVEKLRRMGIETGPENFYTSTGYTIDHLKKFHPEIRRLFLLGMACIAPEFEAAGFELDDRDPQAVVVAFDRTLTYEKLCRAAWFLRCGVPGFATHPDVFCPTDNRPGWSTAAPSPAVSKFRPASGSKFWGNPTPACSCWRRNGAEFRSKTR